MDDDQFHTIQEILNSDRYTAGEKGYVKFQLGISDGFYANFWETIARADDENQLRLGDSLDVDSKTAPCLNLSALTPVSIKA